MAIVDLTGEQVCQELAQLAPAAGMPVASWPLLRAWCVQPARRIGCSTFNTDLAKAMHVCQGQAMPAATGPVDVRVLDIRICLICRVIVRRQVQEHCTSITAMIRHYVVRRGQGDGRSPT